MAAELRLRLPQAVLHAAKPRADGKIFYGVLVELAGAGRIIETTIPDLAHRAWTTDRSVIRWLHRFEQDGLIAASEQAGGVLFLRLPPAGRSIELSIPHSLLPWPRLSAESQLIWAVLKQRMGRAHRRWIMHSELGALLGRDATNAANAGRRCLKALVARNLLRIHATERAPHGRSEIELTDPGQVWAAHVARLRAAFKRHTA